MLRIKDEHELVKLGLRLDAANPTKVVSLDGSAANDKVRCPMSEVSLRELLPPLLPDEFAALKASIAETGYVGEPIVGDQDGGIVDGFHRQRACDELGIDCPREVRQFATEAEKFELSLRLNCRRRQLTRKQRQSLIGAYLRCDPQITDKHLADIIGVSQNTVARVRETLIATFQVEKFDKLRGRDGKHRPTKYKRIVANTAKEQVIAQAAIMKLPPSCNGKIVDVTTAGRRASRHVKKQVIAGKVIVPLSSDSVQLYHCPFQRLEEVAGIAPESVHLLLTDIPYGQQFLAELDALGALAKRILVESGLFVTYSGQYYLDQVMRVLGEHLSYRWMAATTWNGDGNPVHPLDLVNKWKPIIFYSKGDWRRRTRWHDLLHVDSKEKKWHAWQQPLDVVERLVQYFSESGELVVDPCGGSFTTALACRNFGRRFIGCDVDQQCVLAGQTRLSEEIRVAG